MTVTVKSNKKWKPIYLVEIYRMARLGMTDIDICKNLKVCRQALTAWKNKYPELKEVYAIVTRELSECENLPAWIYSRLSPELRGIWDKIEKWDKSASGLAKIKHMLQDQGKMVRQQLFLYALCVGHFSPSVALAKVHVTKGELDRWISSDPDFAALVDEVAWHKGNFFEEALVRLVDIGNPQAVLFANKTFNRDRGYEPKTRVDVNVTGGVLHGVLDLAELLPYLAEGTRLEVLQAIKKKDLADRPKELTLQEMMMQQIAEAPAEVIPPEMA